MILTMKILYLRMTCYIDEQIYVMRCILSTPINTDSLKRISMFHTLISLNSKPCKLVIDGGIRMNVISQFTLSKLKLKPEPHPCPFKV